MNYPIIRDYKLDLHQEFDVNKIPNERYTLRDNQNVFVPRHAPFFMDSLVIKDDKGQELTEGTDYRIFKIMGDLTTLAATGVACLVEMLNSNYRVIYLSYHTIGNSPLFDRSLVEMINSAAADQRLIKWKNIHGKPVVFTPKFHTHLLPFDVILFQDVIKMFTSWSDNLDVIDPELGSAYVVSQVNLVRNYIERNTAIVLKALKTHAENHDAHALNKGHIGLGKVDNVLTATLPETLRGLPNLRVTTKNLKELIIRYGYNSSTYLKANVIPITYYGDGTKGNVVKNGNWNVVMTNPSSVIFNGKTYILASGVIDLRTVKANPASTTFYLYARLIDGKPVYQIDTVKRFNSNFNAWIGVIVTNASAIETINTFNVFLLNGHSVSETKSGGNIPAVKGDINAEGQMAWIRAPEVIQQ